MDVETINFAQFPLGLPPDHVNSGTVNAILQTSFRIQHQMGMVQGCIFINIILKKCLSAIGIDSDIVYGCLDRDSIKIAHLWLTIDGRIVDNSFSGILSVQESVHFKLSMKSRCYIDHFDPLDDRVFNGDEYTRRNGYLDHNPKQTLWFINNQDKALLMYQNVQNIQYYYNELVKFVKSRHNVDILLPVSKDCWSCGNVREDLKTCKRCKIAKYCGKICQKKDWKCIHSELCRPPGFVHVL